MSNSSIPSPAVTGEAKPSASSSSFPPIPPSPSSSSLPHQNLRRLSSRQNLVSRQPSGILQTTESATKPFEKETKVVDGIAFTATTNLSKFSFKKATVTVAKDEISEDSVSEIEAVEEINEGKARNFEFTNNKSLMRVFRAIIFLQMIALICDNPAVKFPPLFDVLCRTPLFYLIRFYSFPFVDVVYIIQKVWKRALEFFISLYHLFPTNLPAPDSRTPQRHLQSRSGFPPPPLSVISLCHQLPGHHL
jgi:hypothetical protein